MVGMAGQQLLGPIDLLGQHGPGEQMRPCHGAKRDHQGSPFQRRLSVAVGTTDQEGHVRHRTVTPPSQPLREACAVQLRAAPIKRHQHGLVGNHTEQQLALASDHLGRGQLPPFLHFTQGERPADSADVMFVEVALGAPPGTSDGCNRELHVLLRRLVLGFAATSFSSAHIFSSA